MTSFRNFEHLLTTKPHNIYEVYISDLHLAPDEDRFINQQNANQKNGYINQPALVQAFLKLLDDLLTLPSLKKLYILGDWFEFWVGDDLYLSLDDKQKANHWLYPIVQKLKALRINGCEILVMHGNRDFLMTQAFCNEFAGELIFEPYITQITDKKACLEHGDALCIDDKNYQRFRKITRNKLVQWWFLKKPLQKRQRISQGVRHKSKKANANKSIYIMDVNVNAVKKHTNTVDILIHGHTHRPNIHKIDATTTRYVLGDWRIIDANTSYEKVTAIIAAVYQPNNNEPPCFEMFEASFKTIC